ncbi:ribosome biogenesis GTPase YqeH [Schleiferilactobacillus harbinensis]|uniref:ribosome biogenesis GTPase YqeH n=1 Tax=Schleiferilactobacillus harbinensis TaxID=304207 RepID=UPI003F5CDAEC
MKETIITTEDLYCIGCGAKLQTTDPAVAGYIPASALTKQLADGGDKLYCQRCFRLRHYNEITDVPVEANTFTQLLNALGAVDALIVNVVDVFDFTGSVIPGLHRFVGHNPVILVGNKADVLPHSVKRRRVTDWLRRQAHAVGLRPEAIQLVSAAKGWQIPELLELIEKERRGRDVYFVGTTNTGKSTLINAIIKETAGIQDLVTTSRFPGTTLDRIEIPLDDGQKLIDTPGIIQTQQIAHILSAKDLKLVAPQKEMRPRVFQLQSGQTLFLAGLARIDFVSGAAGSFTVYVDNDLLVHRTKLINADAFWDKHRGELLAPPSTAELADFPDMHHEEFTPPDRSDIVIAGLGWVNVPGRVVVDVYTPQGIGVGVRPSLIGNN